MDKAQAIHNFWSGFNIKAYDENTVPQDAQMPYITYGVTTDSIGSPVSLSASLWYRSSSWADIQKKADEIDKRIVAMTPPTIELDDGRFWITKGTPFAQRMGDPDDETIKRIYINLMVEFLTN